MKTKLSSIATVICFLFFINGDAQITLYGLTDSAGANHLGTIFSITPSGNFNLIADMNSNYAAIPEGSLLYASDGNFYATSVQGGFGDSCAVFRCNPNRVLYTMINLDTVWDNATPEGNNLIQANDNNLYGMTTKGGDSSIGVIFKLQLSGQYSALHFFSGVDGAYPYGSLIQLPDSILWGMTSDGGTYGAGTIFKCTISGIFTSKYSFDTVNDGENPFGNLLRVNDSSLYGLTSMGGKFGFGTLFKYNPISNLYTKLVDFNDTDGAWPYGSLIQATDSNLYGLTLFGGDSGAGYGTLFQFTLSGNLKTLVVFHDSNGANPYGTLLQAKDSNLYGMTYSGGNNGEGSIFKCALSGNFTKIYDFNSLSGVKPLYGH